MIKNCFKPSNYRLIVLRSNYQRTLYFNKNCYSFSENNKPDKIHEQPNPENNVNNQKVGSHDNQIEHHGPKTAWGYFKEFIHLCIEGSKQSYREFKYERSIAQKPKDDWNIIEIRDARRIHKDMLKLIPFSFFVLVPFAELLLPPYLLLFPNAMPRAFMFDSVLKKMKDALRINQEKAYHPLKSKLELTLAEFGYDLRSNNPDELLQTFLKNVDQFNTKLNVYDLDSEMMKNAADFLMIEYFDGTNIINQLYRHTVNFPRYMINLAMMIAKNPYRARWEHPFFTYQFKFDFLPFSLLKKLLLRVQIQRNLESIQKQNLAIKKLGLSMAQGQKLDDIGRQRGVKVSNLDEIRNILGEEWLNHNLNILRNDQNLIFWHAVIQFARTASKN